MSDSSFENDLLDSLKNPILFADTDHVVRYANKAARQFYSGGAELIGKPLFDCHQQRSCEIMKEVLQRLEDGLAEELIVDSKKHRIYMRAVRNGAGRLLGYYERFEPPRGS